MYRTLLLALHCYLLDPSCIFCVVSLFLCNVKAQRRQLDGGTFHFVLSDGTSFSEVIATSTWSLTISTSTRRSEYSASPVTEYWYQSTDGIAALTRSTTFSISESSIPSGTTVIYLDSVFTSAIPFEASPESTTWRLNYLYTPPSGATSYIFSGYDVSGIETIIHFAIESNSIVGVAYYYFSTSTPTQITPSGTFTKTTLPRTGFYSAASFWR